MLEKISLNKTTYKNKEENYKMTKKDKKKDSIRTAGKITIEIRIDIHIHARHRAPPSRISFPR